jgi:hypothetical protein
VRLRRRQPEHQRLCALRLARCSACPSAKAVGCRLTMRTVWLSTRHCSVISPVLMSGTRSRSTLKGARLPYVVGCSTR